jgi:dsDNA-specific endonuclease/ATPase MutS2
MPDTLISTYDKLLNQLREDGKVQEKTPEESRKIMKGIEQKMELFRQENQQKARASQEEIASLVLTA